MPLGSDGMALIYGLLLEGAKTSAILPITKVGFVFFTPPPSKINKIMPRKNEIKISS
jgi:hypothetical protein